MKVYGKIINTIPEERIVKIEYNGRLIYLYMSRKLFKDFGPYFYNKPYIFVETSEKGRRLGDILVYDVESFVKVVEPNLRERKVFYDISTIKKGVKSLLEKIEYKMSEFGANLMFVVFLISNVILEPIGHIFNLFKWFKIGG